MGRARERQLRRALSLSRARVCARALLRLLPLAAVWWRLGAHAEDPSNPRTFEPSIPRFLDSSMERETARDSARQREPHHAPATARRHCHCHSHSHCHCRCRGHRRCRRGRGQRHRRMTSQDTPPATSRARCHLTDAPARARHCRPRRGRGQRRRAEAARDARDARPWAAPRPATAAAPPPRSSRRCRPAAASAARARRPA